MAAGLAALALAGGAQAASVADFLARADRAKAGGMFAVFSSESRALKEELLAGIKQYGAERKVAKAKGSTALGCPPERFGFKLDGAEFVAALRAIVPVSQQASTSFQAGVNAYMRQRFPCPG
jgi:hypothetical protein